MRMAEQLAYQEQAQPSPGAHARERMPQIVDANILEPRAAGDAQPWLS